jgi:hypothetical protein
MAVEVALESLMSDHGALRGCGMLRTYPDSLRCMEKKSERRRTSQRSDYSIVKFITMPLAACKSRVTGSGNRHMMA